jgi:hypothetical protein
MIASWFLVVALADGIPPFPPLPPLTVPPFPARVDARRCDVGATSRHADRRAELDEASDCALVGSRWVATSRVALGDEGNPGGVRHVRIAGRSMVVAEVIPHPRGARSGGRDVVLLRLADDVPDYPLAPPPGEHPSHVAPILDYIAPYNAWIAHATGRERHGRSCTAGRRARVSGFMGRFLRG